MDATDREELTDEGRQEFLADTHLTVPSEALTPARALKVLPPRAYILGCQLQECGLGMGLSESVERRAVEAIRRQRELCTTLLVREPTAT